MNQLSAAPDSFRGRHSSLPLPSETLDGLVSFMVESALKRSPVDGVLSLQEIAGLLRTLGGGGAR
jgi:hypothetical protein